MKKAMIALLAASCGGRTGLDPLVRVEPVAIEAANRASCVLYSDGNVRCWGDFARNNFLYNNVRDAIQPATPASQLAYPKNARQISVHHNGCAVTGEELLCWGYGPIPPSCIDDTLCTLTKTQLYDVIQVSVSQWEGGCALTREGRVFCWGYWFLTNQPPLYGPPSQVTKEIHLDLPAKQISVGAFHACALLIDATIRCWGTSAAGESAPGIYNSSRDGAERPVPPTPFPKLHDIAEVQAGDSTTCVRTADDQLLCWGVNKSHQLTDGLAPKEGDVKAYFKYDGNVFEELVVLEPTRQSVPGRVRSFSLTHVSVCAINEQSDLFCWGRNVWGQTGVGTPPFCFSEPGCVETEISQPTRVEIEPVRTISVGITHSCAIAGGGKMFCWGKNTSGELGDGTRTNRARPVAVDLTKLEQP